MNSKTSLLHRAAAACAFAGAVAIAAPVHANQLDTTGWLNGFVPETTHRGANNQNVNAGGFTGTYHTVLPPAAVPITFWCFDLDHTFNLGMSYPDYSPMTLSGALATQLAQLFQEASGAAASFNIFSAAFQLAIWELEYDSGNLDVTMGSGFSATGGGANGTAARSQANMWLANLGSYTGAGWTITELVSGSGHQNFIVGNLPPDECCKNVPEPPVLPLVLAALGAVALVGSRRRRNTRGG